MTSAHRSSESAHRSGEPELKTEIFIVKTSDTQDAVIVSFVDTDSNESEGIFLYEPGVDPIELSAVGIDGVATEFEYATVTGEARREVHDVVDEFEWPGDGMVTRAQRDADVAQATEDHASLQQAYDTLREQAQGLVDAVARMHRAAGGGHPGAFQWCQHAVCRSAQDVEL